MKQIFVVEGKNDEIKLKNIYKDINVISVNGSSIDNKRLNYLKKINDTHEIIIITDPDYAGKKIRDYLERNLTNVKHVFLKQSYSKSANGNKIGLEHVDDEIIKNKLNNIVSFNNSNNNVFYADLLELNLAGSSNSSYNRLKLTNYLNIDKCNAKRLVKRLNGLNINLDELKEIIKRIEDDQFE